MARKPSRNLQAISPTLIAYGNQVRFYRERLGLSQDRLGERFPVSGSYIGQIEVGKTRCTFEFAEQLDDIVGAQGCLVLLWKDLVENAAYPTWFDWPPIEREAVMLQAFELSVVHGLLQTPKYAAAAGRRSGCICSHGAANYSEQGGPTPSCALRPSG